MDSFTIGNSVVCWWVVSRLRSDGRYTPAWDDAMIDDRPDMRYWTAYDHYMAERDAQARKRALVIASVAKRLRLLKQRIGTTWQRWRIGFRRGATA